MSQLSSHHELKEHLYNPPVFGSLSPGLLNLGEPTSNLKSEIQSFYLKSSEIQSFYKHVPKIRNTQ